ncbi:hypothetical protein ACHAWO_004794 [Cyclotella atomus]|uniref:Uncharacterized protein n=1 Tax=Cyclotella atomus TaxID=382360 RepID=A0ABD3QZ13_9STRA
MAIVDRKLLGGVQYAPVLLRSSTPLIVLPTLIPNAIATQCLNDLVAVRQGPACRAGVVARESAIFFTSPLLGDEEFWCSKHFVQVRTSCPDENVFAPPSPAALRANPVVNLPPVEENVTKQTILTKTSPVFRALGIYVYDDREPAPETAAAATATTHSTRDNKTESL